MLLELMATGVLVQATGTVRKMRDQEMYSAVSNVYVMNSAVPHSVRVVSVADLIAADIESIPGVSNVVTDQHGTLYSVDVILDRFEFDVRRKVYLKEQELYSAFPEYDFNFRVMPASADASDAVRG